MEEPNRARCGDQKAVRKPVVSSDKNEKAEYSQSVPTSGPPKHAQASDPIWGNAAWSPQPAGAGKNAQKDNLSYIASSRGRAPFNFPRAKMGRVPGPAREHVSRRKPTQRAPCHCPGYHGQS
ncbi:MAG: hypothetical protein LQ349_007609 [Xanthoria aureola]|nr:MAG: hypothetical protein LQ349_007609 [Xanthoria aureola]